MIYSQTLLMASKGQTHTVQFYNYYRCLHVNSCTLYSTATASRR